MRNLLRCKNNLEEKLRAVVIVQFSIEMNLFRVLADTVLCNRLLLYSMFARNSFHAIYFQCDKSIEMLKYFHALIY